MNNMSAKRPVRFDWAMKYILRNKANFDVLESFLSNLLKEDITVLDILESESNQEAENRKFNRVYLRCKDSEGRQIIIEMQNQREVDYYLLQLNRVTSTSVVEGLQLGSGNSQVFKVISISILYHTMGVYEKKNTDFIYYGTTELVGTHTKKPLVLHESVSKGEKVSIVTGKDVFPEYYMIYVEKFQDMIDEAIDEWVYFFKHSEIREDFKSPGILLAAKKLDYLMMSEEERRAYDGYLAYLGYELGILDTAKEEGRAEARTEGRDEKAIEIAKKLLKVGDSIDKIQMVTNLPIATIKQLAKELGL
jgi:hypothetical protein